MTKSKGIGRGGARKGAGRKSKKAVHIKVWKWESAPEELKALSHSGFGCCDVSEHVHPDYPNYQVRIGAHA